MSVAPTEPPAGTVSCLRCGGPIGPDQDWCLECGAAARTRLAPTPGWRAPIAVIVLAAVLAMAGLAAAFVALTNDEGDRPTATATTAAPAPAPAPAPTPAPATTAAPAPTTP